MFTRFFNKYFRSKVKTEAPLPKNGKWKEFNKHAILISEGEYENGLRHGLWKFYYDSGELIIEENYENGVKNGSYTAYHRNGKIMSSGQFSYDKREGTFNVYNEQGALTRMMVFKSDELIKETIASNRAKQRQHLNYDLPMMFLLASYVLYWASYI